MAFNSASNGDCAHQHADPASSPAPDPQVSPGNTPFGNRYSRAYKLRILKEADACTQPGEIGKLLRREGLLHTSLTSFRRQRASGALNASPRPDRKPQAKPAGDPDQARRVLQLEREVRKLRRQLEQAEAIIDVQKKVSRLLEISLVDPEGRGNA